MNEKPVTAPYAHHIFLCTGEFCDPDGEARRLYQKLPELLDDLADYDNPVRVKRGTSPCLGVCAGGPLLVVYPEGIWYHDVDEATLKRIIDQHLRHGQPVTEKIFYQLRPNL